MPTFATSTKKCRDWHHVIYANFQTVTLDATSKAISVVSSAYLDPTYIFVISSLIKQKNT